MAEVEGEQVLEFVVRYPAYGFYSQVEGDVARALGRALYYSFNPHHELLVRRPDGLHRVNFDSLAADGNHDGHDQPLTIDQHPEVPRTPTSDQFAAVGCALEVLAASRELAKLRLFPSLRAAALDRLATAVEQYDEALAAGAAQMNGDDDGPHA